MSVNHQTLLSVIIRNMAAGKGHLLLFKVHLIDMNTIHWQRNKYTMSNSCINDAIKQISLTLVVSEFLLLP